MPVQRGGAMARRARLSGTAVAVAGAVCGAALAEDGASRPLPYYEIAAAGGGGTAARVELDAAIPVLPETLPGGALLLQPGALLSRGPDGHTLAGASLGAAWRFEGAGGIVGLNAFYDGNRVFDSGRERSHRQASLGADYQAGRSRIGANWYIPLSGRRDRMSGAMRIGEYAVGGPELHYRLALDGGWSLRGRALRELDRGGERFDGAGAEHGWLVSAGLGFRIGCTRLGLDVERDTRRGETAARLSLGLRFGADAGKGCADAARPDLYALVEREKIVATRTVVAAIRRIVPLTRLPDDATALYEIDPGGAADADTVWLFAQGGPIDMLDSAADLRQFDGHEGRILVNVHQVQTYNPRLIDDKRLNSLARLQAEMDVSVEILDRVIRHFKARGKRVVVFSHSFGSFVVPRYLALKGPGAADRYVIMAGRLDIESKMYENRLGKLRDGGTVTYFYEGGTTLTEIDVADISAAERGFELENGMLPRAERMFAAFQGTLGRHRYTMLLARTDLSKAIYVYGTMDMAIGRLTEAEIAFLESRDATVVAVNGGHGAPIDDAGARARVLDWLER